MLWRFFITTSLFVAGDMSEAQICRFGSLDLGPSLETNVWMYEWWVGDAEIASKEHTFKFGIQFCSPGTPGTVCFPICELVSKPWPNLLAWLGKQLGQSCFWFNQLTLNALPETQQYLVRVIFLQTVERSPWGPSKWPIPSKLKLLAWANGSRGSFPSHHQD